jgi:hypothetical protein
MGLPCSDQRMDKQALNGFIWSEFRGTGFSREWPYSRYLFI